MFVFVLRTLCIYILLYIPWWYFGGMFIINVTFVNLTLSWGIPGYHKLITNKPQIAPFQILSQKYQKLINNQPQIVLFDIYIHISFLKNITNSIPCFNLDMFWLLEVSVYNRDTPLGLGWVGGRVIFSILGNNICADVFWNHFCHVRSLRSQPSINILHAATIMTFLSHNLWPPCWLFIMITSTQFFVRKRHVYSVQLFLPCTIWLINFVTIFFFIKTKKQLF